MVLFVEGDEAGWPAAVGVIDKGPGWADEANNESALRFLLSLLVVEALDGGGSAGGTIPLVDASVCR